MIHRDSYEGVSAEWIYSPIDGVIYSAHFHHDAALELTGDFADDEEKASYAMKLCALLNATPSGWNDALVAVAKLLRSNADGCSPGSAAEQQNWPFALESMAREVDKMKIPPSATHCSETEKP